MWTCPDVVRRPEATAKFGGLLKGVEQRSDRAEPLEGATVTVSRFWYPNTLFLIFLRGVDGDALRTFHYKKIEHSSLSPVYTGTFIRREVL